MYGLEFHAHLAEDHPFIAVNEWHPVVWKHFEDACRRGSAARKIESAPDSDRLRSIRPGTASEATCTKYKNDSFVRAQYRQTYSKDLYARLRRPTLYGLSQ